MRLIEIRIEEFGKLTDCSFELGRGLNLIDGPNESGKSTLLAFLRFVFYGFPRKNSTDGEERDKRLSWRTRRAAGSLIVEIGRKRYQIFRSFSVRGTKNREQATEDLSVILLPSGETVSLGEKSPGEFFMGIPMEIYDSSLCVRQSDVERICSLDVGEALGGFLFSGKSGLGAEQAEEALDAARRDLLHVRGRGGRIAELEDELSALEEELQRAREDAESLQKHREDTERYLSQVAARRRQLGEISAALEAAETARTLSLFDEWHRACAEAARLRAESAEIAARHGELLQKDSREDDARIRLLMRDYAHIGEEIRQKASAVEQLRARKGDEKLLSVAKSLSETGGAASTLSALDKTASSKKRSVTVGVLLLLVALLCGAAALWQPLFLLYAAIGAGCFALGGVALLLRAGAAARKQARLLATLGVKDPHLVRTYLAQCQDEAAREEAGRTALEEAESELAKWRGRSGVCLEKLQAELRTVGYTAAFTSVEAVEEFLRDLAHRREVAVAESSAARVAVEHAEELCRMLEKRLVGIDEEKLRARYDASLPHANESPEELKRARAFLQESIAGLESKCTAAERAEAALAAKASSPEELETKIERCQRELGQYRDRLSAIVMALEVMREAEQQLRGSVLPRLCEDASELFSAMTGGEHKSLHLAGDFSVTLDAPGGVQPLSRFSAGCRDAACLSLRLALLRTVTTKKLPLFFDEALSRLDDERALAMLTVLEQYAQAGGQCLLFSCHSREAAWLSEKRKVVRLSLGAPQA